MFIEITQIVIVRVKYISVETVEGNCVFEIYK